MRTATALRYAPAMPAKGRPSIEGEVVSVRLPSDMLKEIDKEVERLTAAQPDEPATRAKAIRSLLRAGINARNASTKPTR